MKEPVQLKADDNIDIAGELYPASQPKGWLVLLHMMPATKESWQEFAECAQAAGYEAVAIDFRGHGASAKGLEGYKSFSDLEHQLSIRDVGAAWRFLQERGATPEKTTLIGASIGANFALWFLAEHPEMQGGILLSPGNYRGIDSARFARLLDKRQRVLFVASRSDTRFAADNAAQTSYYHDVASQAAKSNLVLYEHAGHGTDLFHIKGEPDLKKIIINFLDHGTAASTAVR